MSIENLKTRLRDVSGIQDLTMTMLAGRQNYGFAGKLVSVDAGASEADVEKAIRDAAQSSALAQLPAGVPASAGTVLPPMAVPAPNSAALIPSVGLAPATQKGPSMTAPGSFAASIKAMLDDARAGVAKAREDGLAKVGEAVKKLGVAKDATVHVAGTMAKTIEEEAASVMSELGQISNDLGV